MRAYRYAESSVCRLAKVQVVSYFELEHLVLFQSKPRWNLAWRGFNTFSLIKNMKQ